MSKIKFSENQRKALSLENVNTLVSAGAGSGKTAVLIQRLFDIFTIGKIPTNKVLVLTFTKLAAEELKTRIKDKLNSSDEYQHLASKIDTSDISTFDSFALNIVKKYGYYLNYDPSIGVLDTELEKIILEEAFTNVMQQYYDNPSQIFKEFYAKFIDRSDNRLLDFIKEINYEANFKLDEKLYLDSYIDTYYSAEAFNRYVDELNGYILTLLDKIKHESTKFYNPDGVSSMEPFFALTKNVQTLEDLAQIGEDLKKPRAPKGLKEDPADAIINERLTSLINKELKVIQSYGSRAKLWETFLENKQYVELLLEIYMKVRAQIQHFKRINNVYTFTEIARFAYELVSIPDVLTAVSEQYTYIMIDEYQDTSDIQETFIKKIARDNVYMVGDIKQSIYGFRNANCKLFEEKYDDYGRGINGVRVDLNDNYRSREEVINSVNSILSEIMTKSLGGANYAKEHVIEHGNKTYNELISPHQYGLDVRLYEKDPNKNISDRDIETKIIIQDIKKKISDKYLIYDKEIKELRPCEYRDFTILMPQKTEFDNIERLFNEYSVPIFPIKDEEIASAKVMQVLYSALVIYNSFTKEENPQHYEFRHAVASFLRGYVVEYTDQQLFDLLNPKDTIFANDLILAKFAKLTESYKNKPILNAVNAIIKEFDFFGAIYKIGNVYSNTHKLRMILEEIEGLSNFGYDLTQIIQHFAILKKDEKSLKIKRVKLVENAVNMMSIHNSKGLEFPIIYYAGNNGSKGGRKQRVRITKNYGFIFPEGKKFTFTFFLDREQEKQELLSERIRLLYVALTRASETMVVLSRKIDESKSYLQTQDCRTMNELLQSSAYFRTLGKVESPNFKIAQSNNTLPVKMFDNLPRIDTLELPQFEKQINSTELNLPRVSDEVLKRGELLHKYFEVYDFDDNDLTYIHSATDREHFKKLLSLPVFETATSSNIYREYSYYDYDLNREQIIDCFIILKDKIVLIDFKLANIAHARYDKQVRTYKKHLISTFNLPVKAYLLSLNSLVLREVE